MSLAREGRGATELGSLNRLLASDAFEVLDVNVPRFTCAVFGGHLLRGCLEEVDFIAWVGDLCPFVEWPSWLDVVHADRRIVWVVASSL